MFPTSPQHAAVITEKIVEFIAKDMRPLSVVDGDGFKQLINFLEPGWKVPLCTHVTSICHKSAVKEHLLTSLSTVQFVAVTFGQAGQHKAPKSNQKIHVERFGYDAFGSFCVQSLLEWAWMTECAGNAESSHSFGSGSYW